jgi:tetratricopeptide (TPR) repeat protein
MFRTYLNWLVAIGLHWGASFGLVAQDANLVMAQANELYASGAYSDAIGQYSAVLSAAPNDLNALLQRGFCHGLLGQQAAAIADFSAVIAARSDHGYAYICRGSAYLKMKDYAKALADMDQALLLDKNDQEAYNNRGWVRKAQGDHKGACADWRTSQRLGNAEAGLILKNTGCK